MLIGYEKLVWSANAMTFWGAPSTFHRVVVSLIVIFAPIFAIFLMVEGWRSIRRKPTR